MLTVSPLPAYASQSLSYLVSEIFRFLDLNFFLDFKFFLRNFSKVVAVLKFLSFPDFFVENIVFLKIYIVDLRF